MTLIPVALLGLSTAALASNAKTMQRFDAMLGACVLPPAAIACIDDPKMRTLFRGVAAAAEQPKVRNAFAVVEGAGLMAPSSYSMGATVSRRRWPR